MRKLSRKESMALATIHDVMRELRSRGRYAQVSMMSDEITISDYADTTNEVKELRKLFCFFKDDDDIIEVRKFEANEEADEWWAVRLKKRMVCDSE